MLNTWIIASIVAGANIAVIAADVSATQPTTAPDLSTPVAAVISYFNAVDRDDATTAKLAAIRDAKIDKLIDAIVAENSSQHRYRETAIKRFGADKRLATLGTSEMLINLAKKGQVHLRGDVADIGENGDFPCRKVDGKWRFDLIRQNPDAAVLDGTIRYLTESSAVYSKFATQASSGTWKSLDEMEKARLAAAPTPPPPPEPK